MEDEGKEEGGRESGVVGWGEAKQKASQCAHVCQNYPLAIYPLVSPRNQCQRPDLTRQSPGILNVSLVVRMVMFFVLFGVGYASITCLKSEVFRK